MDSINIRRKRKQKKFTSFLTGDLFLIFMYVIYAYQYAEIVQKGEAYDYTNIFSVILIFSLIEMVYLFFMMRRTKENNAVMNQLMEFHNFMEAADHGEFSNMADTNPENFYHILPYAMAMNEYEEYTKKLDILALHPQTGTKVILHILVILIIMIMLIIFTEIWEMD